MRQIVVKNVVARNFTTRGGDREFFEVPVVFDNVYPGILPDPTSAHYQLENVILSNVESHGTELGIDVGDENDGTIKGLRISNYRFLNPPVPPDDGQSEKDAIAIVNSYKVLIDSCTISNAIHDGIDLKSYDTVVANTIVEGTGKNGVKFWRNGELINSFLARCASAYNDGALIAKFGPCRVVNSAIIFKPVGYTGTLGIDENPSDVGSFDIVNSMFLDLAHSTYIVNDRLTSINSVYFNIRDNLFTGGVGSLGNVATLNTRPGSSNNIATDPSLADYLNGNFALRPGSSCIDAGTAAGVLLPSFDYFGRPRIRGSNPDIGPIEYVLEQPKLIGLRDGSSRQIIQWFGVSGLTYDLYSTSNVFGPWTLVPSMSGLMGVDQTINATNAAFTGAPAFYRVGIR